MRFSSPFGSWGGMKEREVAGLVSSLDRRETGPQRLGTRLTGQALGQSYFEGNARIMPWEKPPQRAG